MKIVASDIVIIGGGLTALSLAYFLKDKNVSVHILEARTRLGGRIHTKYKENFAPQEMGATWLGKKHTFLTQLLEELNIGIFEQTLGKHAIYEPISTSPPQLVTLPPNNDPSFRIQGGSSTLIHALASFLNTDSIYTSQVVQSIEEHSEGLSVKTATHHFKSSIVVSTLPPYLLTKTINVQPALPDELYKIAKNTHTWMGESIKIGLAYDQPFWRAKNSSGTIFSNVGPIPEMYDHSNYEDSSYSLKGFLNGTYYSVSKAERLELILQQLEKYFGESARNFTHYEETVWRNEPFTFTDYAAHVLPHQNNGHPIYRKPYLNGKLFIAGSETAAHHPGYMDGAVSSAKFISEEIL